MILQSNPGCHALRPLLLVLALALGGCSLWRGAPPPPAPRTEMLQPGDNLWIAVAGEEALSGLFPVRGDGTIWMGLIGAVPAAGQTLPAVQESLRQRLSSGYLREPLVEVTLVTPPPAPALRQSQ
jgi:protein involved in polysaccharide export with SLBB domain